MLTCELTVLHILFLDLDKTFRACFLLDNVSSITIYFDFVNYSLSKIEIKPENWEDVQCHEHQALIYHVQNVIIDSIIFTK